MNLRKLLLNISIPITKFIAKVSRPAPRISTPQLLEMRQHLRSGDVIVCFVGWELSNLFLPGKWKHCGVYVNGWVYESTISGVRKVLLEEFCLKKDKLGIARLHVDFNYLDGLVFLEENLSEPYDYGFTWDGSSAWYCSKYVFEYLRYCSNEFQKRFTLRKTLGEYTVTPTDFWLADKFFEKIYEC